MQSSESAILFIYKIKFTPPEFHYLSTMLKPLRILLPIFIVLSGCYPVKYVVTKPYTFDKDISFTIDQEVEGSTLSGGYQSFQAKRGYTLIFLTCTFKNNSAIERDLYLSRFHLLDPKSKTKYKIEFALAVAVINLEKPIDSKIKGGEIVRRRLVFVFPKKQTPELFSVDDDIYNIAYTNSARGM